MKHKKLVYTSDNETGCKKSKMLCKPKCGAIVYVGVGGSNENIILLTCAEHPIDINTVDTLRLVPFY